MASIASRDLRNHTADALERVRQGERLVVTVHGEPVAELLPPSSVRPRFLLKSQLLPILRTAAADPGLRDDLAAMTTETTDDLGAPK